MADWGGFFISTCPLPGHDGKFMVVGQVVEGLHVVKTIADVKTSSVGSAVSVEIANCGQMQ